MRSRPSSFLVNAGGEILGDGERHLAELAGEEEDGLGGAGLALGPDLAGFGEVGFEGEDAVEGGIAFYATELEGADDGVFLAAGSEGDERIGDGDAAEVEGVGGAFGSGVEKGRRDGRKGRRRHGRREELSYELCTISHGADEERKSGFEFA